MFAACNLLGGVLGEISLRATLWASAVGPGFGLLIARGFVEVNPHARGLPVQVALQGYKVLLRDALRFVRRQRLVQWNIALLALFSGSASWLLWLYQHTVQLDCPCSMHSIRICPVCVSAGRRLQHLFEFEHRGDAGRR